MSGEQIPVFLGLFLAAVVVAYFYYNSRNKAEIQKTLKTAIEKGVPVDEGLLTAMAGPSQPDADRRKAFILLATAVAIALFGRVVDDDDMVVSAIALFPAFIGAAYLLLGYLNRNKSR